MKKEALGIAEQMFLEAKGKITNKHIAEAVGVNSLTVGRWKKRHGWEDKLREAEEASSVKGTGSVRKKAARDEALRYFLEMGGHVTNKDVAVHVNVTPATVSKWKEIDDWVSKLQAGPTEVKEDGPMVETEFEAEIDLDIDALAYPEQITKINAKIDQLLDRDHLTSGEIAEISQAKKNLLGAVDIYVTVIRDLGEIGFED